MKYLPRVAGPLILLLITLGFFWKLVFTDQYTWMDHPDLVNQVLPWFQFQAAEWHSGRIPLWDPYHWGGQPLVGQLQPGALYPLNWLLFALPLRDGFINLNWMQWYFVAIHFMAALFCYWLCRDLKQSVPASQLAGIAFGFGGYIGTTAWPQMINGAVWAPLVLLFFLRAMRGERPVTNSALSGAILGVSYLSGHHQVPMFMSLTMAGLWCFAFIKPQRARLELLKLGSVFGLFFVLLSAAQTLPGMEFGRHALRWVGAGSPVGWGDDVPYFVHRDYSMAPTSALGMGFRNLYAHSNTFIGLVALSLAGLAVAAEWRDRWVRLFTGVALGGLFLALGGYSVGHGVLYALLPGIEKARTPAMAIFVFHFGIAVLLGFGADALRRREMKALALGAPLVRGLAILSAFVYTLMLVFKTVRPQVGDEYESLGLTALAALLLALLLHAWRTGNLSNRAAMVLVTFLLLTELANVTSYAYQRRDREDSRVAALRAHDDVARFLKQQPGLVRVELHGQAMPFNLGDWYGIEQLNGFNGVTGNIYALTADYGRLQRLLGTTHYISREPANERQTEVYSSADGLKVYRNPEAQPRVWTIHDVVGVADRQEADTAYRAPAFDLTRQSFVMGEAPATETCPGPDRVSLVRREPSHVTIEAEMSCAGMVVLNDTFYPGWYASVDGKPAPIYEAYGALRGVLAAAGRHRIEFHYRPLSIYLGACLSFVGLLGVVSLRFFWRRER